MKFKTLRTSETGKKFANVDAKMKECFEAAKALIDELGAKQWRGAYWVAAGGISSLFFPKGFEIPSYYKKQDDGYSPKRSLKKGKEIHAKIKALPTVSIKELNACIGFDEKMFKTIGFNTANPAYYLFSVEEEWNCTIPDDCEEITTTEYNKLTKKSN